MDMTPEIDQLEEELLAQVSRWLKQNQCHFETLQPLAGDVSPRRYLRLHGGTESAIVAHYPADAADAGERFVLTTRMLTQAGVRVPKIFDWDADAGMMLLEDIGEATAYDAVCAGHLAGPYWQQALIPLEGISRLDLAEVDALNPPLDGPMLRREVQQSWDLVLEPRGLGGEGSIADELSLALFALCDRLADAPLRPCHRDFMARNLLPDSADGLVVIDHQDLRLAPPWYDLASLLNDSLYASPEEEEGLLDLARVPQPEREDYHRAAAQRALKIVGTFAAFAARGFNRHLVLIEPSLRAARRHLERLPETAPLMGELAPAWDSFVADSDSLG